MRKMWLFGIFTAVLLTGCGARPNSIDISSSADETETVATTTTATEENATTATVSTTQLTTTAKAIKRAMVVDTTNTEAKTKVPENRTVDLNVTSENSLGTIIFKSVLIDYSKKDLTFYYEVNFSAYPYPESAKSSCLDGSGKKLNMITFGGNAAGETKKAKSGNKQYTGSGDIEFYGFNDPSKVTLTYTFKDADPVTIIIDIPGI